AHGTSLTALGILVAHPRYAPGRARKHSSLSSAISVAAALGVLALAFGPLSAASRVTALGDAKAVTRATPAGAASNTSASALTGSTGSAGSTGSTWDAISIKPFTLGSVVSQSTGIVAVAAPFGPAGQRGELGIPLLVLQAYHRAADTMKHELPSCHLPWWLLAGIGHTESGHAEDGRLFADGTTRGRILGPVLNGGIAGDAVITDTDHGVLDGDVHYDRAVGPMQFIPSTWATAGADGNGDHRKDPNNIFDATLAAGRYLCAHNRDLATTSGLHAAILSYNNSQPYLATVLAWGTAYRDRAVGVNGSILPVVSDVTKVRPPLRSKPSATPATKVSSSVAGTTSTTTATATSAGHSSSSASSCPPTTTTAASTVTGSTGSSSSEASAQSGSTVSGGSASTGTSSSSASSGTASSTSSSASGTSSAPSGCHS
ncbi:MAG: hypothetical protein JWN47_2336, partial [Frankiales bacterium]|nr:hypothetical protein [Frankiales bacterium]